jgi:hypothetical protein
MMPKNYEKRTIKSRACVPLKGSSRTRIREIDQHSADSAIIYETRDYGMHLSEPRLREVDGIFNVDGYPLSLFSFLGEAMWVEGRSRQD